MCLFVLFGHFLNLIQNQGFQETKQLFFQQYASQILKPQGWSETKLSLLSKFIFKNSTNIYIADSSLLQNRCPYFGEWELSFPWFFCAFQQKQPTGAFRGDQAKIKGQKKCHKIRSKNMGNLVLHLNSRYYHREPSL